MKITLLVPTPCISDNMLTTRSSHVCGLISLGPANNLIFCLRWRSQRFWNCLYNDQNSPLLLQPVIESPTSQWWMCNVQRLWYKLASIDLTWHNVPTFLISKLFWSIIVNKTETLHNYRWMLRLVYCHYWDCIDHLPSVYQRTSPFLFFFPSLPFRFLTVPAVASCNTEVSAQDQKLRRKG